MRWKYLRSILGKNIFSAFFERDTRHILFIISFCPMVPPKIAQRCFIGNQMSMLLLPSNYNSSIGSLSVPATCVVSLDSKFPFTFSFLKDILISFFQLLFWFYDNTPLFELNKTTDAILLNWVSLNWNMRIVKQIFQGDYTRNRSKSPGKIQN